MVLWSGSANRGLLDMIGSQPKVRAPQGPIYLESECSWAVVPVLSVYSQKYCLPEQALFSNGTLRQRPSAKNITATVFCKINPAEPGSLE